MDATRLKLTCLLLAVRFIATGALIPDHSVLWSHHGDGMYFTSHLIDWLNKGVLPTTSISFDTLGTQVIYGFAYWFDARLIVHSDRSKRYLVVTDISRNTSTPFFLGTSPDVGQITIDWKSGNIYWADSGFRWIAMKALPRNISTLNSYDQGFKVIAEKNLDKPSGLAVYPDKFYLFWADEGYNPKIERSSLDGSNRTVIVWKGLIRPMTLAIDYNATRLYWTDPHRFTIEVCDLDGLNRHVFASEPQFDYFGIAIFQNNLVFTVPGRNLSGFYSTALGATFKQTKSVLLKFPTPVYDVEIYAEEEQRRETHEPCDTKLESIQCEEICIRTALHQHGGFGCFCEDGYHLQNDGRSCQRASQITERSILYTDKHRICQSDLYTLEYPPKPEAKCNVIEHEKNITRFTVVMATDVIIFTDGLKLYREKAFHKVTKELLYSSDDGEITDIAYDWLSRLLYWTVQGSGRLFYLNLALGSPPVKWMSVDSSDITLVTVDPTMGNVFFIQKTAEQSSLHVWDGLTDSSPYLIVTRLLNRPTDLEYDPASWRLVWFDVAGYIGFIDADGSNEGLVQVDMDETFNPTVAPYKNYVILTAPELSTQIKILYDQKSLYGSNISTSFTHIRDILIFDTSLQSVSDRCDIANGGCEQICFPVGEQQCACHYGYTLQLDLQSCSSDYAKNNEYLLVLDELHGFVRIDIETQEAYVLKTDASEPSDMAFDEKRSELMWTEPRSYVMKRQHVSNTKSEVFGESFTGNGSLAVDPTSGNVYYSSMRRLGVVGRDNTVRTLLDQDRLQGPILKITLLPEYGQMALVEGGTTFRLVQANMDGSNMVVLDEFSADIGPPDHIVYDRTANDRILYYCHGAEDKIVRQQTDLYTGSGHHPIAMDVTEEFVFFIPRYSRSIVRIHKLNGRGETIIVDSPLSGILKSLYIPSVTAQDHLVCGQCNGDCSTLCLPVGETKKTCACADNDVMTDEGICGKATVCEAVQDIEGLNMGSCCYNLPGTVCYPTCSSEYTKQHETLQCLNGNWEHNPGTICKAEETDPGSGRQMAVYIGAGVGGAVVLIIVIVVIVCVTRKKARKNASRRASQLPSAAILDPRHDYDTADNYRPPVPAPRPLSNDEEADGGVYSDLDEATMKADEGKIVASVPQDKRRGSNISDRKNRYSGFPKMDPYDTTRSAHDYLDLSGKKLQTIIQEDGGPNKGYIDDQGYLTALGIQEGVASYHKPNDKVNENVEEEPDGYLSSLSLEGSWSGGGFPGTNVNRGSQDKTYGRQDSSGNHFPAQDQRQPYQGPDLNNRPTAHHNRWHGNESDYLRFMNRS